MCGIYGIVHLDGSPADNEADRVRRGVEALRHRGPDASGIAIEGPVAFGHARLSIIDLEGGAQPMRSADGEALITYNGEVYNFRELRADLTRRGMPGATRSDTEVVLDAVHADGTRTVPDLRGIFAFAVADFAAKRVLLARDHLGVKPLFYTVRENRLYFASELEALYRTAEGLRLDPEGLDEALAWQYIPAPRTIYRGVRQLPPAHWLEIDLETGRMRETRYWSLGFTEDRSLDAEGWAEKLDTTLREAVALQLVSDVPFGAFLSGGVDSSLVVRYMSRILEQPVRAFTVGFREMDFSECEFAAQVARHCGVKHEVEIMQMDAMELLPVLARHYGQPFGDASAIPTYLLAQMARRHVKMVLSGDGGDENFAGYRRYELTARAVCPDWRGGDALRQRLRNIARFFYRRWLLWAHGAEAVAYAVHTGISLNATPAERRRLLRGPYREAVADERGRREHTNLPEAPLLTKLQHVDLMSYLPFDILTKVDIASMAHGLEVRVPLLDHKVVETAAAIPPELKLREEKANDVRRYEKKWILRNVAKRHFPAAWIDRAKQGFRAPLKPWFAGELRAAVRARLVDSPVLPRLMNTDEVARLVERHSESLDLSPRLWNLLMLETWLRTHADVLG